MNEVGWFFSGWAAGILFTVGALLGIARWSKPPSPPQEIQPEPVEQALKKKHRTMWG